MAEALILVLTRYEMQVVSDVLEQARKDVTLSRKWREAIERVQDKIYTTLDEQACLKRSA